MSRKRPMWSKSAFSQNDVVFNSSPQKSARTSSQSNRSLQQKPSSQQQQLPQNSRTATTLTDNQISSSEWIEIFSPKFVEDLAVNLKKISEIENWLKHCEDDKNKKGGNILLLTGPTGSGKSTSLRVLAKKINYELVEWITPIDIENVSYRQPGDFSDNTIFFKESQVEMFKRFLFRASRYGTIFEDKQKRFIIVEDIPNVFIKDSSSFGEILQNYKLYGKSPLIFIVTDSKSRKLNLSYNLFPDDIRSQLKIMTVNFNSVSMTLMRKALKRISILMNANRLMKLYDVPNQNLIDSIILASNGDIRNACINLHFVSLKGASQQIPFSSITKTKKKNNKADKSEIGCDENLTLMHALGRVFYPKIDLESKKLTHSPEELCQSFLPEPKTFIDFMFSNYLTHFSKIENIVMATDIYSQSDIFMTDYRENLSSEFGLNLAIRGNMVYNANPISTWASIRGPKKLENSMNYLEELKLIETNNHMTRKIFSTDYKNYGKIIKNNATSTR